MNKPRQHEDLFTAEEAAAYLHLENIATLDTFRAQGWLNGYKAGKKLIYRRDDLDDCALRIVGIEPPARLKPPKLKSLR
jgi:hypothetical protein